MSEVICSIYYKGELFQCASSQVKHFLKRKKYYLVTNRGNQITPLITYHTAVNRDEEEIGDFDELIKFMSYGEEEEAFILCGFSRAIGAKVVSEVNLLKKQRQIQEQKENIQDHLSDKYYKIRDFYEVNNLVVARFCCSSEVSNIFGLNTEMTKQKYIFEVVRDSEKENYIEIFTGFKVGSDVSIEYPYILDIHPFIEYFPDMKNTEISKLGLVWAQNDINFKSKRKIKK